MKYYKGFKYRLKPTLEQEQILLQCGGNTRFVWNYYLKFNMDYYEKTGKFIFWYDMIMMLPKLKAEFPFLKESNSQSLQAVARSLDKALKASFKIKRGFPKFKKKDTFTDSFYVLQHWHQCKSGLKLPKIGWIKWIKDRPLQGKPKSVTVTQDGNKWYASVLCEITVADQEKKNDKIVGCDVGLKEFATLSNGTIIPNPRHLQKYEKKLACEQRKLAKKNLGSNNRLKQRMKVHKVYEKIRNVRKDFLHKATDSIAKTCDGLVLEDLSIQEMMKNRQISKAISDVSWYEFRRQLEYKCKWRFKYCIIADRFFPSTKTCSCCGNIQNMSLSKRVYDCELCGLSMDRDMNAAFNLEALGRGVIACGDEGLPSPRKQEKEWLGNQPEALVGGTS